MSVAEQNEELVNSDRRLTIEALLEVVRTPKDFMSFCRGCEENSSLGKSFKKYAQLYRNNAANDSLIVSVPKVGKIDPRLVEFQKQLHKKIITIRERNARSGSRRDEEALAITDLLFFMQLEKIKAKIERMYGRNIFPSNQEQLQPVHIKLLASVHHAFARYIASGDMEYMYVSGLALLSVAAVMDGRRYSSESRARKTEAKKFTARRLLSTLHPDSDYPLVPEKMAKQLKWLDETTNVPESGSLETDKGGLRVMLLAAEDFADTLTDRRRAIFIHRILGVQPFNDLLADDARRDMPITQELLAEMFGVTSAMISAEEQRVRRRFKGFLKDNRGKYTKFIDEDGPAFI